MRILPDMERTKASFLNRARAQYAAFAEQRYTTIAGTLVFFLVTSHVPLLFFLTLLVGSAGISAEEIFGLELFDWAKDFLVYLTQHAEKASAGANVLFIATTLWSATGFFYHLKRSGEIIYGAPFRRGIRVRVGATVCALVVLFYGAGTVGVLFGANVLTGSLPVWASRTIVYLLAFLFAFFLAWILNAYASPERISPAQTVLGSLFTALSWSAASLFFAVYLRFSNGERLYGALSAVIVFLLFLYWLMICFTAGMTLNARRGKGTNIAKIRIGLRTW